MRVTGIPSQLGCPLLPRAIAIVVFLMVLSAAVRAEVPRLEAETFTIYGNLGGLAIQQHYCESASGEYGVNGLDVANEWIIMAMTLDHDACFTDSVRSAGDVGFAREFVVEGLSADGATKYFADTLRTGPGTAPVG